MQRLLRRGDQAWGGDMPDTRDRQQRSGCGRGVGRWLMHQLQHRWGAGGVGGVDDGVDDGADDCDGDGGIIGVGDGGDDCIGGGPSVQCEQPGCGVAWPPPRCRLAGDALDMSFLLQTASTIHNMV